MGIVGTVDRTYKAERAVIRGVDGVAMAVAAPMALESRAVVVLGARGDPLASLQPAHRKKLLVLDPLLHFLYKAVLDRDLPWFDDLVRAKRLARLPVGSFSVSLRTSAVQLLSCS